MRMRFFSFLIGYIFTMTFLRRTQFLIILFAIFIVTIFIVLQFSKIEYDITELSSECLIQPWNRVEVRRSFWQQLWETMFIYTHKSHEVQAAQNIQNYTETSILAAYVYPDHISMTLITEYLSRTKMFCRYYDCRRKEIPGSAFRGVVYPESTIHCPRRIGAEFVSVSKSLEDMAPTPVRLTFRVFEEPVHELAVCVAPLYGNESSWLPIVDFVEHQKLEGASYFYFYVNQISSYDQRILDDYSRTGDLEVIHMQDKFDRIFLGWHFIQIQDCHMRSKYHAKWTAFIDLDERIQTFGQRMIDLLRTIQDPSIGEVRLTSVSVIKDEDNPERFESLEQLERNFFFNKYVEMSTQFDYLRPKAIIRSEKIGIMDIHFARGIYPGIKSIDLNATEAILRHFRSTKYRIHGSNWHNTTIETGTILEFHKSPLPQDFRENLKKAMTERILQVYDEVD